MNAANGSPRERQRSESRGRKTTRTPERRKSSRKSIKGEIKKEKDLPNPPVESAVELKAADVPAEPEKPISKPKSIFNHIGKTTADFNDHIISVKIHSADALATNLNVRHPLVRVSLIGMYRA